MSYQSEYSGAQVDEAVGKALNPDAAPTQNSTNLVESGGVASAVSDATELKVGDSVRYTGLTAIGFSNAGGNILTIPMTITKIIPNGVALTATNIQVNWIRGNGGGYTASDITGTINISAKNNYTLDLKTVSLPVMTIFSVYFSFTLTVVSA